VAFIAARWSAWVSVSVVASDEQATSVSRVHQHKSWHNRNKLDHTYSNHIKCSSSKHDQLLR
jgi:hypothetical protein